MSIFGEKRLLSGAIRQPAVDRIGRDEVNPLRRPRENWLRRATANTPARTDRAPSMQEEKNESKIRISGTCSPMQDWITIAQIGAVHAKRHHIVAVSTAEGRGPRQQWEDWIS
jgi:hypothetical protein